MSAPGTADEPVVELEDVQVHFDSGGMLERIFSDTKVRAVDGVSLEIGANDVVALVGESGCGKTTVGKTAVGLQRPTGGTVSYRGQDIWEAKKGNGDIPWSGIRRALQIIHQDPSSSLNPNRTVLSTLSDPLKRWQGDLGPQGREERVHDLLERVGMEPTSDYAARYPHQLSGGEKQRVALGRALLMNPEVVLADEAVSALDVSLRIEMMDLMLELQDLFDTSYLLISHDLANARYMTEEADGRIAIMYLGRIVEIGSPEEILKNPKHPYTKVMVWSTPALDPEVAASEATAEPPIREIDIPDPADPPSGCHFHTRCPEAREACTRMDPELMPAEGTQAACFRVDDTHEYWSSEPIGDDD